MWLWLCIIIFMFSIKMIMTLMCFIKGEKKKKNIFKAVFVHHASSRARMKIHHKKESETRIVQSFESERPLGTFVVAASLWKRKLARFNQPFLLQMKGCFWAIFYLSSPRRKYISNGSSSEKCFCRIIKPCPSCTSQNSVILHSVGKNHPETKLFNCSYRNMVTKFLPFSREEFPNFFAPNTRTSALN